ncbi:hypothetical protein T492DRAFT_1029292 [Pavlovales sp. CCMP2436]|nr:hypothetical protein T492DRAFT_1029292 [Pavlovales sp. CCMP2436]|mmetsp:Transcript_24797/g.62759  ORF Transcript_24797/g.62759 Transcript_24797/m.62759 type:complete len:131 (+) Transcript_24797:82-474(+)
MAWLSRGLAAVEPWLSREHILGLLALAVVGALTLAYAFARPRGVRASAGEGAQTRAEAIASARVKQQATMNLASADAKRRADAREREKREQKLREATSLASNAPRRGGDGPSVLGVPSGQVYRPAQRSRG